MKATRFAASLLATLLLGIGLAEAQAQSDPLESLRTERQAAESRDRARLAELIEDRDALEAALEEARAVHAETEARHEELQEQARELAERGEALDARQNEQGDDLEAILASLKRHSGELRDSLADSWLVVGGAELPPRLDDAEVLELEQIGRAHV